MNIAGRFIGREHPAYLIAEIGGNHGGNPATAEALIRAAAQAGADAVKFQAYRPEYLVTRDATAYWGAGTQAEYFAKTASFPQSVWAHLAEVAAESEVTFLLSAFDEQLVDDLDALVPAWKIASGDITHEALIRHIAAKGKPILLSTGASTPSEIRRAVSWCGDCPVAIFHCVLSYPALASEANLLAIQTLAMEYPIVGWSDHIIDADVVPAAYTLGARVIEKHFTTDRAHDGPDHAHSWDPVHLRQTRRTVDELRGWLGSGEKVVQQSETAARVGARRALHEVDGKPRMLRPAR